MKISIDFDGTITRYPGFFRELMWSLLLSGNKVGVLTGRHHCDEQEVRTWLVANRFPKPDFVICRTPTEDPNTGPHKAEAIELHDIDYHIDDCDRGLAASVATLAGVEKVICIR